MINNFIIMYCQGLKPSDFTKVEDASMNRKGRREYSNYKKNGDMMRELNHLEAKIETL